MTIPIVPNKSKQNFFLNVFLMFSILTVCVLAVEFFCYSYLNIPAHMPPMVYFDPSQKPSKRLMQNTDIVVHGSYREFRYRITTDALGFRRTYPFENNREIYSFSILGDSQSFGVGVNDDQTFASLLAKKLDAPVLNTACPGYNTIEEFWTYQNRVRGFKPDHVLLFFFAGNDPYENYKNRELYDDRNRLENQPVIQKQEDVTSSFSLAGLKNFLSKRSAIYNSLIKLRQYPLINKLFYHYKLVNPAPPPELAIFKKDENQQALTHWQITEQLINDLRKEVESSSSKFWLVFIPDRYQVDKIYWQQWVSKYNLNPENFDLTRPNLHLAEFSKSNGIRFIDTTERLIEAQDQGKNAYWKIDAHLNALGHQVIADQIVSALTKHDESIGKDKK